MNPDVSVIIPSRNRLWSLPQCVDSCRSTKILVEIIVVDDASTDGTADWLKNQKDVVTISGEGWGKPWAVAKALSVAKGTFVRFLDSDDWLTSGANEDQFAAGERENADLVVSGYHAYRDQALTQTFPWELTDDFIARQLGEDLTNGCIVPLSYSGGLYSGHPSPHILSGPDFVTRRSLLHPRSRSPKPRLAVHAEPALCHRHHDREGYSLSRACAVSE